MTEDQRHNPKLLVGIIGGLTLLIAIFFAYQWLSSSTADKSALQEEMVAAPAKPPVAVPVQSETEASVPVAETETLKLVEEDILDAAVPENASLAKEEIAKLNDIQQQLNDQEQSLKQQHSDADELIKLKEEQIKLLEAQLAQQAK
ncbi:hypothetical protein [Acinetobacter amyesii]|uniref:hypothetical protein n=1 Tax=Acinetobacter amyesii TaxID=2942470 RepID=UPI0020BE26FB|nr:hypothetical protein [Acinetobacter amyesii]MCL6232383.1 hypothetical protein [Acinetobacter amyesii]